VGRGTEGPITVAGKAAGSVGDRRGIHPAERPPEESNRVVLDPVKTDDSGIPAARIQYRDVGELATLLMAFHQERAKESLEAAGAYETVIAPFIRATGWHLLGTAMMGWGSRGDSS